MPQTRNAAGAGCHSRHSLREPPPESAAAIPGLDVGGGASGGDGVGARDVRADARAAAGRVGDAIGGALPDRALRLRASPVHPSAERHAVRGAAEGAHHPRDLFSLTFLAHFAAILFHTLVLRDGILKRLVPWRVR